MAETYEDPNDAPKADRVIGYKCNHCEQLHVALLAENGEALATAVITVGMILDMLDKIAVDAKPEFDA